MTSTTFNLKAYPLPEIDENILNSDFSVSMSIYNPQPLFNIGFNYYIHQSYDNYEDTLKSQGTKTFYNVVNGFEIVINDQDKKEELIKNIKMYLNINKNEDLIENNLFLQFWEIFFVFKLLTKNNKINIASKRDTNIIELSIEQFCKKMSSISPTGSKYSINSSDYDIGILLIDNYYNSIKEVESNIFKELFNLTVKLLDNLNSDGSIIIELNDTFTLPTIKFISLMKSLFKKSFIYKPYYSRPTDSVKYLICSGFDEKAYKKISKKLKSCLDTIIKDKEHFVSDIFSDVDIPKQILTVMTYINIYLSGIQHKEKNKIIRYIKSENYFGQEYQDYLTNQLASTEFFLSRFFPVDSNDLKMSQSNLMKNIDTTIVGLKEFKNNKQIIV
jgi:hypothetical protein